MHTPGPWRLQKMRQEGMFSIGMGTFYATGLIGEANARLIAAAPDLLEALEAIAKLKVDGPHISAKAGFDEVTRAFVRARNTARAAIAKARKP